MIYPLIINGNQIFRSPFEVTSTFYPQYKFQVSNASQLDIASAIGAVRRADRSSLSDRKRFLENVANSLVIEDELTEHVVRMTGMPVRMIRDAIQDIKRIFRATPEVLNHRFKNFGYPAGFKQEIIAQETITSDLSKVLLPMEGFCYAVTPGNDPRASAIVAANLGYLGIPFIIRASIRDAVSPIIIKSMIEAGFDSNFCNLIYLDRDSADYEQKHFKIVDACSCMWTFGQPQSIDQTLRYQASERSLVLTLTGSGYDPSRPYSLKETLGHLSETEFNRSVRIEPNSVDHFKQKMVIRHESGNCAAILNGPFDKTIQELIYPSIGYANICTAMKSLMIIAESDQTMAIADMLSSLVVGDPLHPDTQVGFIDSRNLDYLSQLVKRNSLHMQMFGGERRSTFQANPLLITSQEDLPDFLGQEIPAYVLTTRNCQTVDEAIIHLNMHLDGHPRLGVSLLRLPEEQLKSTIVQIDAHIVLINKPTSLLLPAFHEGNDYVQLLTTGKMIVH
jgi:acyl-CoA reductase-like NAD-dependent aldehyde dehydrogenase